MRRKPGRWTCARTIGRVDERHRRPCVFDARDERIVFAGGEALQIGHAADERVGEPDAF
jgi:hypothetical protein